MNKKILIVGGTGFIGYHLGCKLIKKNWNVFSISTKKPKKIRYNKKFEYLFCNIANKKKLYNILDDIEFDYVVNCGGYVDHKNKKKTFDSHFLGCKNLADYFLNKDLKSFIQIGSSIENGFQKSPQKEKLITDVTKMKSIYGLSKLKATNYLIKLYKKKDLPVTILRLYLAYGKKQDLNRFLPITINSCLKNKDFDCSNGLQKRDFVYVDDVVEAIYRSMLHKKSKGEIFNLGSGKPLKIRDIIEMVRKKVSGGNPQYGKIKFRKDEIKYLFPSIQNITKKINWRPRVSFNDGLKKTIEYYSEQN